MYHLKLVGGIIAVMTIVTLVGAFFPFTVVGTGHRGVLTNFGQVQDVVLDEGLHIINPFVGQRVKTINVQVQKAEVNAEAGSDDLQQVYIKAVVNFHIDPKKVNKVYQAVGDNQQVLERIILPNTDEVIKAASAQYTAENIIKNRQELKGRIDKVLMSRLADYGVILDDVSLTNVDFSREFNNAIEAKQVAEQRVKQAEFIAQKAEKDAEAAIHKAKGDAEAQRLQQQTLTPLIVQQNWIEAWKAGGSQVPQFVGGDAGSNFIMQLPQ